ncbi:MAG: transposase, partial [Dehalococcoidia bacterium]
VEHHPDPHQREQVGARGLLAHVRPGTLILADLGYFGFAWFDDLTAPGYFWLSRLRAKTSYTVLHAFYQRGDTFDGLVWLGTYRADKPASRSACCSSARRAGCIAISPLCATRST